jgi:hypothetical protein
MARPVLPWTTDQDTYEVVMDENPEFLGFVSEGDSWFAFPSYLRRSIISDLARANDAKAYWLRRESSGDEVRNIMSGRQYASMRDLMKDEDIHIDAILFSGGGNDIVGPDMLPLLNDYQLGMTAQACINRDNFDERVGEIRDAYLKLIALRDKYRPEICIFTHAYDFAIPSGKPVHFLFWDIGPWMKNMETQKGITDPVLQQEIITYMLTTFGQMQENLESEHERIVYIRTQGTLDRDADWGDELHPTGPGFMKIAAKFQAALRSAFPQLPAY